MTYDPRLTPARPDLAAAYLEGHVEADHFVEGVQHRVVHPTAPVTKEPFSGASLMTQALHGESVTVYESNIEGWSWGQLDDDNYVGWLPTEALRPRDLHATHKVSALRTPIFAGPSIKLPPTNLYSFGCRLVVTGTRDKFAITDAGEFIFAGHLVPLSHAEPDFVEVASRFLGAAYLWGGRSSLGLDCSGLVQVALEACGIACPRDSDMQEAALGVAVPFGGDLGLLHRGDLIFWPGHVGIVEDAETLLHATAHFMSVVREPLGPALARIEEMSAPMRTVRRLLPD